MNEPAMLPQVIDTQDVPEPDAQSLDLAYRNDVYDPNRDVRNKYPMYAQQLVFNPELRAQYHETCKDICVSGLFGYTDKEKDIAKVKTIGLKGFAMGMDFLRALETIKIIHGMPTIRGPQALHLVRERTRGAVLECVESADDRCVWRLGRPGTQPKQFTGTREQVERAELPARNNLWNVYPARMLKWHTFSEGVQELFGDILMGCYLSEEINLEAQFERDLDRAVESSEKNGRTRGKSPKQGKQTKAAGKGDKQRARGNAEGSGSNASGSSQPPREPEKTESKPCSKEQRQAVIAKSTELAKLLGARWPTEDMADEQRPLIEKEWRDTRARIWEQACANALQGELPAADSITSQQATALIKELSRAIKERSGS